MERLRGGYRLAALSLIALVCSTTPLDAQPPSREQPRFGGVLKVATPAEPPSLDPHGSNAAITSVIMWHVFEKLYTFDKDWSPIPDLAEGHTVTDGGRQYTITLRKGVRFHSGKEMTSADVVASLHRWGRMPTLGKALWKSVDAVDAKGPYEVVIHLKEPSGALLSALAVAVNGAAIYPKEVIDATGDGPLKQFIGTGPFRFVEHKPDRHVRLARFKEYAARGEPPDGAGRKRVAYLDELLFIPVPDVAVRLAGVESGSYHYSQNIKQDQYNRLLTMRAVEPRITGLSWVAAVLNHKQGLMTGKKLRQAFQAALDMEPIMAAGIGHPLFYRLDPGLWPPELNLWHSTAGGTAYNQQDKHKARRLLTEAGYAGQPVRWLTTQFEHFYKTALVAKQQLEEVGFKIDLQILDLATLAQRSTKPELFDVFSMTWVVVGRDPALSTIVQCTAPGSWCLEEKDRLVGELARETNPTKRKAIIDRIQVLFYEDVGQIKFGDLFYLAATRKELRGEFRSVPFTYFWNAWLEKK